MRTQCKCGGKRTYTSTPDDQTFEGVWICNNCSDMKQVLKKGTKAKKVVSSSNQSFSALEIGEAIIAHIRSLESKVAELESCVSDRDNLQKQVYEMQEKMNSMKLRDSGTSILIPFGARL